MYRRYGIRAMHEALDLDRQLANELDDRIECSKERFRDALWRFGVECVC